MIHWDGETWWGRSTDLVWTRRRNSKQKIKQLQGWIEWKGDSGLNHSHSCAKGRPSCPHPGCGDSSSILRKSTKWGQFPALESRLALWLAVASTRGKIKASQPLHVLLCCSWEHHSLVLLDGEWGWLTHSSVDQPTPTQLSHSKAKCMINLTGNSS